VINVRRLAQEDGIPYSTLNKTVAAFEDAGLLVNTSKTQRNRIYSYKQYLDLFQDI
jgi:predicted transcriptional regulator